MEKMTRTFREALEYATNTVESLAGEAGYSRESFDVYRNRRPPSRAAVLALADALEIRAYRLAEYSGKLREAADEADGASGDV